MTIPKTLDIDRKWEESMKKTAIRVVSSICINNTFPINNTIRYLCCPIPLARIVNQWRLSSKEMSGKRASKPTQLYTLSWVCPLLPTEDYIPMLVILVNGSRNMKLWIWSIPPYGLQALRNLGEVEVIDSNSSMQWNGAIIVVCVVCVMLLGIGGWIYWKQRNEQRKHRLHSVKVTL